MNDPLRLQIGKIAQSYFDYLAGHYPIMCLSDEFYFFPRAKKALDFLNLLDSLDQDKIKESVYYVKKIKGSLDDFDSKELGLEAQIDLVLLKESCATFLREFDEIKIWQIDPSIYLKIALIGINQILTSFSFIKSHADDYLRDRIAQIPRLLDEARKNLKKVPAAYLEAALEMIDASIDYLKDTGFIDRKILDSLEGFKGALIKASSSTVFMKDRQLLEAILRGSFSFHRGLEEIFEIASREYHETLKQLEEIAKEIGPGKTWQEILCSSMIEVKDKKGLLGLYSSQIKNLQDFIREKDIISIPKTQDVEVSFTPSFMEPIRASASYSSPLTDDKREPIFFYVTRDFAENNLHNEYIFVTAHETYPGHHLLDSVRRSMTNPIRQQIESPLFYEGWASYGERLIDELGYIKDPEQKLLGLKRQAWRAVRAMLDVGIRINKLKFEDAQELLRGLGYEPRIVKSMFRHYILSPGYQLCYTIGKFEIDRLRERFSSRLTLKGFHDFLLEGGQLPFDLIEKRMEAKSCSRDS